MSPHVGPSLQRLSVAPGEKRHTEPSPAPREQAPALHAPRLPLQLLLLLTRAAPGGGQRQDVSSPTQELIHSDISPGASRTLVGTGGEGRGVGRGETEGQEPARAEAQPAPAPFPRQGAPNTEPPVTST